MSEALTVFFTVIFVLSAIFMVIVILLQSGKSGGLGLTFGGTTQTIFGASGGATFLVKATVYSAIIFMLSSMVLSYLSHPRSSVAEAIEETEEEGAGTGESQEEQPVNEEKSEQQSESKAPVPESVKPKTDQQPIKLDLQTQAGQKLPIKLDIKGGKKNITITPVKPSGEKVNPSTTPATPPPSAPKNQGGGTTK